MHQIGIPWIFEGKQFSPFDPQDSVARQVNSKVADLSHADAIDTSFLALETAAITAVVESGTTLGIN